MTVIDAFNVFPFFVADMAKEITSSADYAVLFFFITHLAQIAALFLLFVATLVITIFSASAFTLALGGALVFFVEALIYLFNGQVASMLGALFLSVVCYHIAKGYRHLIRYQIKTEQRKTVRGR